jgi:hypothetical protein
MIDVVYKQDLINGTVSNLQTTYDIVVVFRTVL